MRSPCKHARPVNMAHLNLWAHVRSARLQLHAHVSCACMQAMQKVEPSRCCSTVGRALRMGRSLASAAGCPLAPRIAQLLASTRTSRPIQAASAKSRWGGCVAWPCESRFCLAGVVFGATVRNQARYVLGCGGAGGHGNGSQNKSPRRASGHREVKFQEPCVFRSPAPESSAFRTLLAPGAPDISFLD